MLTVATWNVENLFLPGGDSGPANVEVYTRKLEYLAATIDGAGADVICLQELGGSEPVTDLVAAMDDALPQLALGVPDERGIRVGVLSRYPIAEAYDWLEFPDGGLPDVKDPDGNILTAMGRGAVEVVLDLGEIVAGAKLRVVTAHLKSRILSFPNDRFFPLDEDERARGAGFALIRRAAEAVAVRVELNRWMPREPDVPVVLAGDMNDEPGAVTTSLLSGPEDGNPNRPDLGDPYRLYNLADRLPADRSFSRIYRNRRELIDHILISRPLLLAGAAADSLVDDLIGIDENVDSRRDAVVPDHAMLYARVNWP
ncbi:MAG: endonuclease/exonuclease/phosphatase family protein [Jiangellaceae bacterium]